MKNILLVLTLFIMSGCSTKTKNITYFSINPTLKIKPSQNKNYRLKIIKILYPKSIKDKASSNIIYKDNQTEINYYVYNRWSTTVSKQLLKSFIKTLQATKSFKATLPYTSYAKVDFLLESDIYDFYHLLEGDKSYSVISIQFNLIDNHSNKLIKSRKFDYKVLSQSKDAKGYVRATNEAIELMLGDLIDWI